MPWNASNRLTRFCSSTLFKCCLLYTSYSGSNSWNGQFDENANTAQSGAFYQELCEKYPQIIHFSGHTHIPMACLLYTSRCV